MSKINLFVNAVLWLTCCEALTARAAPIIFELWCDGSGSINGEDFAGPIKITAVGDTSNRRTEEIRDLEGVVVTRMHSIVHDSANIEVFDTGTFHFISSTRTFVQSLHGTVGFSRGGPNGLEASDILNGPFQVSSLLHWDMTKSTQEVIGAGRAIGSYPPIYTSGGELRWTFVSGPARFRATIIPEQTSACLLVLGLVALCCQLPRNAQSA